VAIAVEPPLEATSAPAARAAAPPLEVSPAEVLRAFLVAQPTNAGRHLGALRPFRRAEFGNGPALPSEAHLEAANALIQRLRRPLVGLARNLAEASAAGLSSPQSSNLRSVLLLKEQTDRWVKHIEAIWDFYFELFGQRQSRVATWLLAADRIALDCYEATYTGLGVARSVPSPPPFAYMRTGFTPATFRRGVPLRRLGKRANPFPVIELPYHRLVNPWTLGAIHHEVSHNLQSDLGLWEEVPRRVLRQLRTAGLSQAVASVWARCHKEIWADLSGVLLGGPQVVGSLIDIVALSPARAQAFNPAGVHPVPYLRVPINLELLRRMGFDQHAAAYERLWRRLYPSVPEGAIPAALLASAPEAIRHVVDIVCFQKYRQLGGRSLAEVVCFRPPHVAMVDEAAERLARGVDPGIVPARFLVGATRSAFDRRLAPPETIARNFYSELATR
jgi:hypothetical protein